jgi:enamine deaminase RidA (YjgF/YER057c/UK114 family)
MTPEERMTELGLTLPPPATPVGAYVPTVEVPGFLYVSGHGPFRGGEYIYRGKVDSEVTVETAREAADLTMMNALGSARAALGSLNRVMGVVKMLGMVNSDPNFGEQPRVMDGASDLLEKIFGDKGKHARSAVGLAALPMGISVEIEMILAIE